MIEIETALTKYPLKSLVKPDGKFDQLTQCINKRIMVNQQDCVAPSSFSSAATDEVKKASINSRRGLDKQKHRDVNQACYFLAGFFI